MCRLALKTATKPFSPYSVLTAMEAMQEGYDGSGLGLLLRGLDFDDFNYRNHSKNQYPILSGIAHTEEALKRLNLLMEDWGYKLTYDHEFAVNFSMIESQDRSKYFLRVYKTPDHWAYFDQQNIEDELLKTRLDLRKNGEENDGDLTVFSFWPDVATIKEVGWPLGNRQGLGIERRPASSPGLSWPRAGRTPTTASTFMPATLLYPGNRHHDQW